MIIFLGSGVSRPTNLPGVNDLLDAILWGEWHKHTDQLFYPGPNHQLYTDDPTDSVQRFLRYLKGLVDATHAKRGQEPANYEDLFFLIKQIGDQERGESRNAALESFIEAVRSELHAFPVDQMHFMGGLSFLAAMAELASVLIQSVVHHKLATKENPKGLDLIVEIAAQHPVTVVTLNHDLLIERVFDDAGISFDGGFGAPDGDVRWFEDEKLNPSGKVRLLKLHGSINWYELVRKNDPDQRRKTVLALSGDAWHWKTADGETLQSFEGMPLFLTGVGNKIASYNTGIYAEMMFRFHEALKSANSIVMSGYGWGDKGINTRLIGWLSDKKDRRLFLLHERPEEFVEKLTALTNRRDRLKERGQLIEVRKWMQNVTLAELDQLFASLQHHAFREL